MVNIDDYQVTRSLSFDDTIEMTFILIYDSMD